MSFNTFPKNPFPPNSEDYGAGGSPYVLPTASADTLGGVKVGNGLSIEDGVLSNDNATPYSLPTASADTLGGVKIGKYLKIESGVESVDRFVKSSFDVTYSASGGTITVLKKINGETVDTFSFSVYSYSEPVDVFGVLELTYNSQSLHAYFENKVASTQHAVGYKTDVYALSFDAETQNFVDVENKNERIMTYADVVEYVQSVINA